MWTHSWNSGDNLLPWLIVCAICLVAAAWDATQRRIPNWLTGPAWVAGLVGAGWVAGPAGIRDALLGSLLMALPCIVLFVMAGGGAGDAKLMAALGAWLGVSSGLFALLCISVAGIFVSLAFAVRRRQTRQVAASLWFLTFGPGLRALGVRNNPGQVASNETEADRAARTFPYGVAILAGTLTASAGAMLWAK